MNQLILSLFPGIGLFDIGFENQGFCVVRGPDLLWGGDIRNFFPPAGKFQGVIGGSPCQDFSKARRSSRPTNYGLEMLSEFTRVIIAASPDWWLLENVPTVPDVSIPNYKVQRLDLNARECGSIQNRPRHFQFGSISGLVLVPPRVSISSTQSQPTCLATEGRRSNRRSWPDFCQLQGLPRDFTLPGLSISARYSAVGNGVHVAVASVLAQAIIEAHTRESTPNVCGCNCGRIISGNKFFATPACRKRMERRRKRDLASVIVPGTVTSAKSP